MKTARRPISLATSRSDPKYNPVLATGPEALENDDVASYLHAADKLPPPVDLPWTYPDGEWYQSE